MHMPDLERMLQGRNDPKAYSYYCHHFLSIVVGQRKYTRSLRQGAKLSEIATESDEAMGLLVLENSWDRWKWELGKTKEQIKELEREKKAKQVKYTQGQQGSARKNGGWSIEGVHQFSALLKQFQKDREDDTKRTSEERQGQDNENYRDFDEYFSNKQWELQSGVLRGGSTAEIEESDEIVHEWSQLADDIVQLY